MDPPVHTIQGSPPTSPKGWLQPRPCRPGPRRCGLPCPRPSAPVSATATIARAAPLAGQPPSSPLPSADAHPASDRSEASRGCPAPPSATWHGSGRPDSLPTSASPAPVRGQPERPSTTSQPPTCSRTRTSPFFASHIPIVVSVSTRIPHGYAAVPMQRPLRSASRAYRCSATASRACRSATRGPSISPRSDRSAFSEVEVTDGALIRTA